MFILLAMYFHTIFVKHFTQNCMYIIIYKISLRLKKKKEQPCNSTSCKKLFKKYNIQFYNFSVFRFLLKAQNLVRFNTLILLQPSAHSEILPQIILTFTFHSQKLKINKHKPFRTRKILALKGDLRAVSFILFCIGKCRPQLHHHQSKIRTSPCLAGHLELPRRTSLYGHHTPILELHLGHF